MLGTEFWVASSSPGPPAFYVVTFLRDACGVALLLPWWGWQGPAQGPSRTRSALSFLCLRVHTFYQTGKTGAGLSGIFLSLHPLPCGPSSVLSGRGVRPQPLTRMALSGALLFGLCPCLRVSGHFLPCHLLLTHQAFSCQCWPSAGGGLPSPSLSLVNSPLCRKFCVRRWQLVPVVLSLAPRGPVLWVGHHFATGAVPDPAAGCRPFLGDHVSRCLSPGPALPAGSVSRDCCLSVAVRRGPSGRRPCLSGHPSGPLLCVPVHCPYPAAALAGPPRSVPTSLACRG